MNETSNSNRLLKVEEVAELLQMNPGTIYHLVAQRRIPCVKLSARCLRFRLKDLNEWLEHRTQEGSKR